VENLQYENKFNLFHFRMSFPNLLVSLGIFKAQKNSLVK